MTLDDLIALFRARADDTATAALYSDEALARHASEAERRAAVSARLLYDDSVTDGLTTFTIAANQSTLVLPDTIWLIDAARFQPATGGRSREIKLKGKDWLRDQCDWFNRIASFPDALVYGRGDVTLWPTPSGGGTLQLSVYRYPLYELETGDDEPEIPLDHHEHLVEWMLYRAYSTKDGEQGDPDRAAAAFLAFTEHFGEYPDADVQRRYRERRRITTQYGGL